MKEQSRFARKMYRSEHSFSCERALGATLSILFGVATALGDTESLKIVIPRAALEVPAAPETEVGGKFVYLARGQVFAESQRPTFDENGLTAVGIGMPPEVSVLLGGICTANKAADISAIATHCTQAAATKITSLAARADIGQAYVAGMKARVAGKIVAIFDSQPAFGTADKVLLVDYGQAGVSLVPHFIKIVGGKWLLDVPTPSSFIDDFMSAVAIHPELVEVTSN